MLNRPKMVQVIWILIAVGLLAAAGSLQKPLERQSRDYDINPPDVAENYPAKSLLELAPGGLRAPIIHYLWIRADKLSNAGRHYEAMQMADLLCKLQPNFANVWVFHAWNMAWNISVAAQTGEERWRWVNNGIKLLRDEGIPLNRKQLILYQELSWIYFNKMGQSMDDQHYVYKQRLAAMMQNLLAAPPYGSTQETLDAFRPIAEAPLDRSFRRQAKDLIQEDKKAEVLSDPEVAAYAELLAREDIGIDDSLLQAYNRYSLDDSVQAVRIALPQLTSDKQRAISALINAEDASVPRNKLLAFVRAQLLWNRYRMDPVWMLHLMELYGPLDWRHTQSHGLYWATYGLHVCEAEDLKGVPGMNTGRIVLNSLQGLTWNGRMTYIENPRNPEAPLLTWHSDWRFIEPTQNTYIRLTPVIGKAMNEPEDDTRYRTGHINYLNAAIQMLYAGYRRTQAQEYLDYIKKTYPDLRGPEWKMNLDDFVIHMLNRDGIPIPDVARSQISIATVTAYVEKMAGNDFAYRDSLSYARRVYDVYQKDCPERNRLPEFGFMVRNELLNLLIQPRIIGLNLSLMSRSGLWMGLEDDMQRQLYLIMESPLRTECRNFNIDFDKAFPAPPGIERIRQDYLQQLGG